MTLKLQPNELPTKWHHPTIVDEKSKWRHPTNYDEQKKWNHPVVNAYAMNEQCTKDLECIKEIQCTKELQCTKGLQCTKELQCTEERKEWHHPMTTDGESKLQHPTLNERTMD